MRIKYLLVFISCLFCVSLANKLDDWSNEDLCRWVEAVSVPDPVILEIEARELACFSNLYVSDNSIQEPYAAEHGTVFPSPSSNNGSNKNSESGIRFIFNYRVKL